ncbi:hypothetical protein [Desulfomicrobium salsuginis]
MIIRPLFYSFVFIFFYSSVATAGWFGPSNFDECVIEGMKGQDKSMVRLVAKMCEKKFPFEKKLSFDYLGHIKYEWIPRQESISFEIKENSGDYIVTKIMASFTTEECEGNKSNNLENATIKIGDLELSYADFQAGFPEVPKRDIVKTIPITRDSTGSFQIQNGHHFRCMRIQEIYGKYRK